MSNLAVFSKAPPQDKGFRYRPKRPDMTWVEYLQMLLHIAAEIEHALMVQYLYAAYSLGGDQVPQGERQRVAGWRNSILAVAKEEMGHLLTVQNVLTCLGAPPNLARSNFPWDKHFLPFNFALRPANKTAVACYVFAEMPLTKAFHLPEAPTVPMEMRYKRFLDTDRPHIAKLARLNSADEEPHTVGLVYETIIDLIGDRTRIPDSAFDSRSYPVQASWDDWGRGYRPDPYLVDSEGYRTQDGKTAAVDKRKSIEASAHDANVMIDKVATRTECVKALQALSAQGEALDYGRDTEGLPSHFDRFLEIYQDIVDIEQSKAGWSPCRDVALNPTTVEALGEGNDGAYLENETTRTWGLLFNVRYRLLLGYLGHTFRLARQPAPGGPNLRGITMHRVFGEMYNIKTLSTLLMAMPIGADAAGPRAGPPFEMPYTLELPPGDTETWKVHLAMIDDSRSLCTTLLSLDPAHAAYLKTQMQLDSQTADWLRSIIATAPRKDA